MFSRYSGSVLATFVFWALLIVTSKWANAVEQTQETKYWIQTGFILGSPFLGQTYDFKIQKKEWIYAIGHKYQQTGAPCFLNCSDLQRDGDITGITSTHFMTGYQFAEEWLIEAGLARVETNIDYDNDLTDPQIGLPVRLTRMEMLGPIGLGYSLEATLLADKIAYGFNVAIILGKF